FLDWVWDRSDHRTKAICFHPGDTRSFFHHSIAVCCFCFCQLPHQVISSRQFICLLSLCRTSWKPVSFLYLHSAGHRLHFSGSCFQVSEKKSFTFFRCSIFHGEYSA